MVIASALYCHRLARSRLLFNTTLLLMRLLLPALLIATIFLMACEVDDPDAPSADDMIDPEAPVLAEAVLEPTEGNETMGTVIFTQEVEGIRVEATVEGLDPEGVHGFHIHEVGDCSAPDATSAGGHFNPFDTPHGGPDAPAGERHVGDLGNLEADEEGRATYDRRNDLLAFHGEANIVGRSVIVHAQADDLESQPVGDAGARLACGVIEAVDAFE